ncbi:NADH dehydrogenase [Gossypium australe]|uniref:NAD(P)H-quinone oxidoreductase subunit 5, chloroplastic n=1 Tax=Gossypium australe TaxID=47621 RepID=A0A5B6U0Z4_9ROSI|nr:NADH dehydrogenase [Gossypium australe]
MEHTYQYAWVIPLLPLPVIMSMGFGLFLIPTATKNLRRIWAFPSILLLSIALIFSVHLSIQQINGSSIYQYLWSWTINNDFSLEFGYLIDPLTSIMLILITTVGILVLIYSDDYMSHDEGYLRFFVYISFFNTAMLGLVTSSNLIQIYFFWELVGMCSYLLIGFWFTRPIAASACQKAFVTNRVGDFGLLLGILGSLEFRDLFKIANNWIPNNGVNSLLTTLCAFLLFLGAVAKSAQFPLHVWLPDAMEGPTPISALIHAATMVAAGIFLLARLLPLFISLPLIMSTITLFLGATLALAQRDIKRSLAYSTMSQLGYMMLALGMGSYQAALFHLITHAYSKALLFLGSGSIIHSMEPLVGYSPDKSQNMVLMGGLRKYVPITRTTFLCGTLSLCGIPPLACFWSKDEILSNSWLYSPFFGIIASFTAGLTAFYMFRIYLLTFDGYLRVHFQNYSSTKEGSFSTPFGAKNTFVYPHETGNTMLFPLLILQLFTLFVGSIGIHFDNEIKGNGISELTILSKWLTPSINFFQESSNSSINSYEFITNAISSVSLAILGLFIAYIFYGSTYSFFQNLNFLNSLVKGNPKKNFLDEVKKKIYSWSYNRGYIDVFYTRVFILGIRRLAELTYFFDKGVIDGITNGVGLAGFCIGEEIKYVGGGRISSYLFFFLCYVSLFLFVFP